MNLVDALILAALIGAVMLNVLVPVRPSLASIGGMALGIAVGANLAAHTPWMSGWAHDVTALLILWASTTAGLITGGEAARLTKQGPTPVATGTCVAPS